MHAVDAVALFECKPDVFDPLGIRSNEALGNEIGVEPPCTGRFPRFQTAQTFAEGLFKGAPNSHHFAHGLHLGSEHGFGARELFKLPSWNLDHDIIEHRFKASWSSARDVVFD